MPQAKRFSVQISLRHDTASKAETGPAGAEILWASREFPLSSWRKQHLYLAPKSHGASFKHQSSTGAVPSLQRCQTQHTHPRAAGAGIAVRPRQPGSCNAPELPLLTEFPQSVKPCLQTHENNPGRGSTELLREYFWLVLGSELGTFSAPAILISVGIRPR